MLDLSGMVKSQFELEILISKIEEAQKSGSLDRWQTRFLSDIMMTKPV